MICCVICMVSVIKSHSHLKVKPGEGGGIDANSGPVPAFNGGVLSIWCGQCSLCTLEMGVCVQAWDTNCTFYIWYLHTHACGLGRAVSIYTSHRVWAYYISHRTPFFICVSGPHTTMPIQREKGFVLLTNHWVSAIFPTSFPVFMCQHCVAILVRDGKSTPAVQGTFALVLVGKQVGSVVGECYIKM